MFDRGVSAIQLLERDTGVMVERQIQIYVYANHKDFFDALEIGAKEWTVHKRHATVGERVQIGAGAKILGPIEAGDDAHVGANAVVVDDVPAGATVVGIPARVVPREPT